MAHTREVDCLISFVDQLEYTCSGESGERGCESAAPSVAESAASPALTALPALCHDIRCKAASLERLNRDGMGAATEIGELAAELIYVEGQLRG